MNKIKLLVKINLIFFINLMIVYFNFANAYNPKPEKDDFILPMPNGNFMAFRMIEVPGDNFWGDQARVIQIGDPQGGIFEGLKKAQVSGSFRGEDKSGWHYYLAKYELTKGQMIAVMGLDSYLKYSDDPEDKQIKSMQEKPLERHLQKPATFISWIGYQIFLHNYNVYLFQKQNELPNVDNVPGYVRLPTEIEWEFAARGGIKSINDKSFNNSLYFDIKDVSKYAWVQQNAKNKLRPVGLRQPNPLGLYDMIGNAREITSGHFLPEIWEGKPGGLSVRGGDVSTDKNRLRSSLREELEIYGWDNDKSQMVVRKNATTATRLMIGSNVIQNLETRKSLEEQYSYYKNNLRQSLPIGQTFNNPVASAASSLTDINSVLDEIEVNYPELKNKVLQIESVLEKASINIHKGLSTQAESKAFELYTVLIEVVEKIYISEQRLKAYEKIKDDKIKASAENYVKESQRYFDFYTQRLQELADLGNEYAQTGVNYLDKHKERMKEENKWGQRAENSVEFIKLHLAFFFENRQIPTKQWLDDLYNEFKEIRH